jgi:hypothetical protein
MLPDAGAAEPPAFDSRGSLLASAFAGTVVIWRGLFWHGTDISAQRRYLCRAVGRNLTQAEWRQYAKGIGYHQTCGATPGG